MRFLLIILILSVSHPTFGAWYCNQVASEWMEKGKSLSACGVGYGRDENEARLDAFENAKKEFNTVCGKETGCSDKIVNIDPQKSDCNAIPIGHTCRRLFYFHITDVAIPPTPASTVAREIAGKVENILYETNNIQNHITVVNNPIKVVPRGTTAEKYKMFLRSVGGVTIYETNSMEYQGVYLTNPSDSDLEREIKRASKSGAMNRIYIMRN